MKVLVAQLCPTLCDPMDCSLPGSSVHGILQGRILEWIAISFSRGSSQSRDRTQVSCIAGRFFTIWATREACLCWGLREYFFEDFFFPTWTIFEIFIEFVTILFLFYVLFFFFFGHDTCGLLAPWPRIEPVPSALEGEVLTTGTSGKSLDFRIDWKGGMMEFWGADRLFFF